MCKIILVAYFLFPFCVVFYISVLSSDCGHLYNKGSQCGFITRAKLHPGASTLNG